MRRIRALSAFPEIVFLRLGLHTRCGFYARLGAHEPFSMTRHIRIQLRGHTPGAAMAVSRPQRSFSLSSAAQKNRHFLGIPRDILFAGQISLLVGLFIPRGAFHFSGAFEVARGCIVHPLPPPPGKKVRNFSGHWRSEVENLVLEMWFD